MASSVTISKTAHGIRLTLTPARTSIAALFGSLVLSGLVWFMAVIIIDAAWPGHDWLALIVLGLNLTRQGYLYLTDWMARKPASLDVSSSGIVIDGQCLTKQDIADVGIALHRSSFFIPATATQPTYTTTVAQQLGKDAALLGLGLLSWPIRRQSLRSHSIVVTGTGDLGQRHLAYGLDGPTAAAAARAICEALAQTPNDSVEAADHEDDGSDAIIAGAVGVVVGAVVEGIAALF